MAKFRPPLFSSVIALQRALTVVSYVKVSKLLRKVFLEQDFGFQLSYISLNIQEEKHSLPNYY